MPPLPRRSGLLALALCLAWPLAAGAQFIGRYLPAGVPGADDAPGVTVASRLQPQYAPQGERVGDFVVHSDLLSATGYNSDVAGLPGARGSWVLRTQPSLSIGSDWSRDRVGAAFTLDDARYLDTPAQDRTDWTAAVGGGIAVGRREIAASYAHVSAHEDPTEIGSALSATPIPYQVDDLRVSTTFDLGRLSFTPRADVQRFRFGDATLLGVAVSQGSQDRVVGTAGVEARYALSDQRSLVFVLEGVDSRYDDQPARQPSNSSTSVLALGGMDYQADGMWRYRALLGVESRSFQAPQYATHTAPVAEASVVWTPTGLTTVTGTLSRTIEDPAAAGTAGYTYTRGRLVVDHEYLRNVLLQGRLGFQAAEYLQGGGTQANATVGAGARWLLDQHLQLGLDYSFTAQTGSNVNSAPAAVRNGGFDRNVLLLSVRLAL